MDTAEMFLLNKGIRWGFRKTDAYQKINQVIDWRQINQIIEQPNISNNQKKEELGEYLLQLLFEEKGRMEIVDFPLFMECFGVSKKNVDIFKKEMKSTIKFQYRKRTKKMLADRTNYFRTTNLEHLPILEEHKKQVEELDKKYQLDRVFNDNFNAFKEAVERVNERFKKTIFDIRKVDLRQTGYECIMAMAEELNENVCSLKQEKGEMEDEQNAKGF